MKLTAGESGRRVLLSLAMAVCVMATLAQKAGGLTFYVTPLHWREA